MNCVTYEVKKGAFMATWLTTKDIAERTGLSPHTIKNYIHRNLNGMPQPEQYFNRTPVWSEEVIQGWVDSRRRLSPKDKPKEEETQL
jgi:predicted DNA-binding transcriptional regulator AlpA